MKHKSLAHYEVLEQLGQGGMGEVYRARDSKLGREVALKFLPDPFASDPERLARFQREARTLASLQHPNIATLYGLEDVEGSRFLVMELAEGEDLSKRLLRGRIPVPEAVDIARQIALGLEAAQRKGIVHRDLKPANVMLSPQGTAKVLDFGLARALTGDPESPAGSSLLDSPTLGPHMTREGVILGTAAYMSPEQARGGVADHRADIWAFGVILYEMLTGKQLFAGETVSDMLAGVLRDEFDLSALPPDTPAPVRRLLRRCLVRDPAKRLQHIGDARLELEEAFAETSEGPSSIGPAGTGRSPVLRLIPWAVVLVFALLAGILGAMLRGQRGDSVLYASLLAPEGSTFNLQAGSPGPATVAPDGRTVAFTVREADGSVHLYLRPLDAPGAFRLAGTEGAAYPFWSPDGAFIGFFTEDGKLKKIAVSGGPPLNLCEAANGKGGTWNRDGVIVFAPAHNTALHRVRDTGGEPIPVTELDRGSGENSHRHPRFLPDGNHFLFLARHAESGAPSVVLVGSLDGGKPKKVLESPVAVEVVGGYLLYVRDRVLMASPFDAGDFSIGENAVPLVDDVRIVSSGAAAANFSASSEVLVYQTGQIGGQERLVWAGRDGKERDTLGESADYRRPRVSPDGKLVAVEVLDPDKEASDIWVYEVGSTVRSRFTFGAGSETNPVWWPDGRSLLYSVRGDSTRIYRKPIAGAGDEELLLTSPTTIVASAVSADGRHIFITQDNPKTAWDILVLDVAGDGHATPFLATEGGEAVAALSPNGRWLVYTSDESGNWESYVTPFPAGGRKWQVSEKGALYPTWSADGKEIRYIAYDGNMTAVDVSTQGDTFQIHGFHALLQTAPPEAEGEDFSFSPDGQAVLTIQDPAQAVGRDALELTTHWTRTLER